VLDARFRYAEGLRGVLALAAYPLQRAATAPVDFVRTVGDYFSTQAQLFEDNANLRAKNLALAQAAQRYETAEAEAAQLRRLIGAAEKLEVKSTPAEILYSGRDPYSHKIFINLGERQGVKPGSPVADEAGVVGQVTRVHPLVSEVTLITDQDHVVRSRSCATACARLPSAAGLGHARAAVHGRQRRDPERRPPGHVGHRRHLPGRTTRGHGGEDRARRGT
jgi:rod shape-determining protein MreC